MSISTRKARSNTQRWRQASAAGYVIGGAIAFTLIPQITPTSLGILRNLGATEVQPSPDTPAPSATEFDAPSTSPSEAEQPAELTPPPSSAPETQAEPAAPASTAPEPSATESVPAAQDSPVPTETRPEEAIEPTPDPQDLEAGEADGTDNNSSRQPATDSVLQPLPGVQLPGVPARTTPERNSSTSAIDEIATGEVTLDGRTLFSIALPGTDDKPGDGINPIEQRVQDIESILQEVVNSDSSPEDLEVRWAIDRDSQLPVIYVGDRWLMTVTSLDARLQGREPERWAQRLTNIIESALIRARREREPRFLIQQGLLAGGILLTTVVGSYAIARLQRRLKTQQEQIETQIPNDRAVVPNTVEAGDPSAPQTPPSTTVITVHKQLTKRQQRNVYDIKRRLLQGAQVGGWGGSIYFVLGLFPYTRWLQPLIFSTPLQVLGIGLTTYVVIRVSDVLIDQFFEALRDGEFVDPEASQRLALRVSTFSRVLKSVATIVFTGAGLLTALSILGVDLVPLLAGAGIIGLAISFASQSLVKDMINGFLILLEDQYAVGDVIIVGQVAGLVENMNLRITQLRDNEGRLISIPNSTITVVQNLSKDWSRVDVAIDVAYATDPDHALAVIRQVAEEMYSDRDWQAKMPAPPEVLGIDEIDHGGLLIRIWIKTQPLQQWKVGREFRRRLKLALDQEGIAIGTPQQSLRLKDLPELEALAYQHSDGRQLQPVGGRTRPSS